LFNSIGSAAIFASDFLFSSVFLFTLSLVFIACFFSSDKLKRYIAFFAFHKVIRLSVFSHKSPIGRLQLKSQINIYEQEM
ncbi:MAG: hypothetical protein ACOX2V_00205, partial [Clostridia bacterium]